MNFCQDRLSYRLGVACVTDSNFYITKYLRKTHTFQIYQFIYDESTYK